MITIHFLETKPGILIQFLKLGDASPRAVLSFSRKYGAPLFCYNHGRTIGHHLHRDHTPCDYGVQGQPVEDIRETARKAQALVRIVGALRRGRAASRQDISQIWIPDFELEKAWFFGQMPVTVDGERTNPGLVLTWTTWRGSELPRFPMSDYPSSRDDQWKIVSRFIGHWISDARIVPSFDFRPHSGLQIDIGGPDLFGVIVLELALLLSCADGLVVCSGCGISYMPTRKPAKGRRAWCDRCREDGTMWKIIKRDQRAE
jgi:hypothetical protein